jgi:hypothetical protein
MIEAHTRRHDHVDRKILESNAARRRDPLQPCAYDSSRVLRREQEHRPAALDAEASEARPARGDGDRKLQSQEALARLWCPIGAPA